MRKLNGWKVGSVAFMASMMIAFAAQAQTYTEFSFNRTNGDGPSAGLAQGVDGNLYGTTLFAGAYDFGTIFGISPADKLNRLYSFCQSGCSTNPLPFAAMTLAMSGDFYGTSQSGGANGEGMVFKVSTKGNFQTVYSFCNQPSCADGASPDVSLVLGTDGNFYGTTSDRGANNGGTVFKITTEGILTTLYSFCSLPGCADGSSPKGLIQASDGGFFGTTYYGGGTSDNCTGGCGTVFRTTPDGSLTTLYRFCVQTNCPDGNSPMGGLVQATNGNFYGTTSGADCVNGECGTVFEITPAGNLTTLYHFSGSDDGYVPESGLVQATDGNLYGTTYRGGQFGYGTIFDITVTGALTTIYSFCATENCKDGAYPSSALVQGTNGSLYGTTSYGGNHKACFWGCGTVYRLNMALGPFVAFVRAAGKVGQTGGILGQGFTGTTSVMLDGVPCSFTVVSDTYIKATVPPGATTGYVTVTTPTGVLTSNVPFHVIP